METLSREQLLVEALKQIDEIFDPLINHVALFVGRLEAANLDPTNYFDVEENAYINYQAILDERLAAKQEAVLSVKRNHQSLPEDGAGDEGSSTGFWEAVFLLAKHVIENGIRLKIGDFQWDSRKPLHGLREELGRFKRKVMEAAGIDENSELGQLLIMPGRTLGRIADVPENVVREAQRGLENIAREHARVLEQANRAVATVVANGKRELDKAATTVFTGIGKAVPKVKIKKPKIRL